MDVKETNAQVQATCNMLASCAIHLYEAAQGEITLEAGLVDGRKISINIKEVVEAENETADNWISVEDELPPENTLVLCYCRSRTGEGNSYMLGSQCKEWWFMRNTGIHYESFPFREYKVTHWQPLPQRPKEADDENSE